MPHTPETLRALCGQTLREFGLLAIDSGSTDGSVEVLKSFAQDHPDGIDFEFVQIPKSEFGHGKTLNWALARVECDIAVLLNDDATPADERWLERLVEPFKDGKVAAAFSRQLPRPDLKPLFRHDMDRFFPPREWRHSWRHMIHYSHSSAAVRRSVWEKRHYYTDFDATSEDEEWAHWAVGEGYAVAYAPESQVTHSHNYALSSYYRRMYMEAVADMFIFDDLRPGFLRSVKSCVKAVWLDLKWCLRHRCLRHGHLAAALYSPLLRGAQYLAMYRGNRRGLRLKQGGGAALKDFSENLGDWSSRNRKKSGEAAE